MDSEPGARVVRAMDGERIVASSVEHLFKLTAEVGDGRLGLERFVVPPGVTGAVPHRHREHDECFYVLDGQLTVTVGGGGEVTLGPGDMADAPRGVTHGFRNAGEDPVVALCLYTPAGYEQFFRDVHAESVSHGPLGADRLQQLRLKYATDTA